MTIDDLLPTPTKVAQPELAVSSLRCALRFLDSHEMPKSMACIEQALIAKGYSLSAEETRRAWNRAIRAELSEVRSHTRRVLLNSLFKLPLERPYRERHCP